MLNAKFYNLIMYGADMKDCEKIANYLIDNYTVKNLVLNVYLDNGLTYDDESNKLTHSLHYKTDPDMSALSYYSRFLLADPRYGYQKLVNQKKDTLMPQSFDVFDEQTGAYDKRVRDVEPIGSTADYLNAYPVFTDYPNHEPLHLYKTEACMQSVAAIRKVCEENGVNLIVLTAPVYTDYYKNFYDEDITNFYESLAKVTDYWNFSSSSVSSEPRFFYDSTHFRNNIGEMMATRIAEKEYHDFTPAITAIPSDFGTYVTADTPHDYFTQRPAPRTDDDTAVQVPVLTWHQLTEEGERLGYHFAGDVPQADSGAFRCRLQRDFARGIARLCIQRYTVARKADCPHVRRRLSEQLRGRVPGAGGIQHEGDHFRHRRFHRQGYLQGHRSRHDTTLRRG